MSRIIQTAFENPVQLIGRDPMHDIGLAMALTDTGWYLVTLDLHSQSQDGLVQAQLVQDVAIETGPNVLPGMLSHGSQTSDLIDLCGSKTWAVYNSGASTIKVQARADGRAELFPLDTMLTALFVG